MRLWLRDLLDRYDQLSLRERGYVLVALVLSIALLWDTFLMTPLERDRRGLRQQVEMLRAEVAGLEQSTEAIVAQGSADPDASSREAAAQLKNEIAALDERLAGATSGLIDPREMARALEQVLRRTSHLTLHALRTLPPEGVIAVAAGAASTGTAGDAEDAAQLYRHGIEIEVEGTYLEVLRFLEQLEGLEWRFFFERIEFTVADHPQGRLKLVLYTLGMHEGWIGV